MDKVQQNSLDQVLIKTIGSISKALDTDIQQLKEEKGSQVDNEDELFCKSLVLQLKRLEHIKEHIIVLCRWRTMDQRYLQHELIYSHVQF